MSTSRRSFIRRLGGAAAGAALAAGSAAMTQKRPRNILFLMCDQHRPDGVGRYGDPYAITPTLDALAAQGTSFRQTYCQNPVCVPARNAILMGRYSHSMGVLSNGDTSRREFPTFPQYLRSKGYTSGCFGKLHVKGRNDLDWDVLNPPQAGQRRKVELPPGAVILPTMFSKGKFPLGAPDPRPMSATREWRAKEGAIAFMREQRDRPWVIQCSMNKPHPAFQPPKSYWDKIDRSKLEVPRYPEDDLEDVHPRLWEGMVGRDLEDLTDEQVRDAMQGYYGNVAFADAMMGEVVAALDDLRLRDDTLIVYTADHGEMLYHHRLWTKFCFFDASVRVPLIFSLPGVAPAGRETSALVEHIDLFPTFMELLGLETPAEVQGRSFVSTLTGDSDRHRDAVRSEHYFKGDNGRVATLMHFDGRFKTIDNGPDFPPELYDLESDPREITSLPQKRKHKKRVETTVADLREWVQQDAVPTLPRRAARNAK